MSDTITLHLADTDTIFFLGLLDQKIDKLRRGLFRAGLATSEEVQALRELREKFLNGERQITSSNTFT